VAGEEKRFSCALTATDVEAPALVVEPRTFFTRREELGDLPELRVGPDAFMETYVVLGEDRAFAEGVLEERMRGWLSQDASGWAFELSGRWLLCYSPRAGGARDALGALQALSGFVGRISPEVRERYAPAV
jgi:hypothetical protein